MLTMEKQMNDPDVVLGFSLILKLNIAYRLGRFPLETKS
ncbi:hypothetical protein HNQ59_000297 [Chitinivorax tropicus]|uniref:Uncharacterized protein n=1 Tax=Chitinivorax tropicus TaxID=714531 RepID=A0A840MHN7_9PROT|nr:hypothetical protein [Chitinivorax tropicus]